MKQELYHKIRKTSLWYYNRGLQKACVHDLSGAIEDLSISLKYNKRNMHARNLLGLVYYETGEVVSALCQWIISYHFEPQGNIAKTYIDEIQADKAYVEQINQSVRKFNQALIHARHNSDDLAMIQLKQVLEWNPNHINAQLLLVVLLMRNGNPERAGKLCKHILQIDTNQLDAKRYLAEIESVLQQKNGKGLLKAKLDRKKEVGQRELFSEELEEQRDRKNYGYLLTGLLIGLLFIGFLVVPDARQTAVLNSRIDVEDYEVQIESLNAKVSALSRTNAELQQKQAKYDNIPEDYFATMSVSVFDEAYEQYCDGFYETALTNFTRSYELDPENKRALFFMGKMNQLLGDVAEAKLYFAQVIEEFPDTEQSEEAIRLMKEMNPDYEVPKKNQTVLEEEPEDIIESPEDATEALVRDTTGIDTSSPDIRLGNE
ncbi:MAG: tetratricopeptide repeat protein [Lachnospiraceae bacterium]